MYDYSLHNRVNILIEECKINATQKSLSFQTRLIANTAVIRNLYLELYGQQAGAELSFDALIKVLVHAHTLRTDALSNKDLAKEKKGKWFTSNEVTGLSLYVDRFCGGLKQLTGKLDYFTELGVNLLHLMPLFESPEGESDGGYAVSDFRKVDARFGTMAELQELQKSIHGKNMYLMLDIVLNHTSHLHEWAEKAKKGNPYFQDFFYMFTDRNIPDEFEKTMPEIFPESSPGNFTWVKECDKWVMTVFHNYQWDLNFSNPKVFIAMLEIIFYYANLGVDILRIDAPAFIWKQKGTSCQNLPKAHTLLRLIKQCVQVSAPGMALLGEAIVAPNEIMKYFGKEAFTGRECDLAYNATQMALQWDALATGDTRVMLAAQPQLLQKPTGCTWITYTRCHDDIGLGYDDSMITAAGFNAYEHRKFIKEFYSGEYPGSTATGALFSVNPITQDARISGSLASLCGLEHAIAKGDAEEVNLSIKKILLMQAQSLFIGGLPMLFYGDELGYTNDYAYLKDSSKDYDNRWLHRPLIDWNKNKKIHEKGSPEQLIFSATKKLIALRSQLNVMADTGNLQWLPPHNIHVAGFLRTTEKEKIYCLFNFSNKPSYLTWYTFKEHGSAPSILFDHWSGKKHVVGADNAYFIIEPYAFCLLEAGK